MMNMKVKRTMKMKMLMRAERASRQPGVLHIRYAASLRENASKEDDDGTVWVVECGQPQPQVSKCISSLRFSTLEPPCQGAVGYFL